RRDAVRVANQTNGERGDTTHIRLGVLEQRDERGHTIGQPDTPDGQRRAMSYARLRVAHERKQIGLSDERRGGSTLSRRARRNDRRWRERWIGQQTPILEAQNPAELLLPGHNRRRRRGRRRRAARDRDHHTSQQRARTHAEHQESSVAERTRSVSIVTPMPVPEGTSIVPSGRTSIPGSIRSGA